jgi:methionyl-tRNA synthetase
LSVLLDFRRAAAETRALWVLANGYIQEQAPWTGIKSDPARAAVTTRAALNLLSLCAVVAWSIVPILASRVLSALGDASDCPRWPQDCAAQLLDARKGDPITRIEPLVIKLTEPEIAQFEGRFSGG